MTVDVHDTPAIRAIETMHSIREFKPDPMEDNKIQAVLEAAVMAP